MNGTIQKQVTKKHYLGVIVDKNLTYKDHIDSIMFICVEDSKQTRSSHKVSQHRDEYPSLQHSHQTSS